MVDDEYNKKLESLQQYVPFLNKVISQLKDPTKPNREQQLAKISSLHSMITDKKKLKLATLTKCEEVILQLVNKAKFKTHTQVSVEEPPACLNVTTSESTVISEAKKDAEMVAGEPPTSPSYTPPKKPVNFSVIPKQNETIHSLSSKVTQPIRDPSTTVFVEKPSVFDRLGTRVFYQSKPVMSFDQALASFRERLKNQEIILPEDDKSNIEKSSLRVMVKVTGDGIEEEKKAIEKYDRLGERQSISESEEKEDREKHIERPKFKERSELKVDLKKEGPRYRKTSEEKENSKEEGPRYQTKSEEKQDLKKERLWCRTTSEERENSKKYTTYGNYKERRNFRDLFEAEDSKKCRGYDKYRERSKYKKSSEEREPSKRNEIFDKRRGLRGTSEETEDSETSPISDKYKEIREIRKILKSSEEKEDLKSRHNYKYRQKYREASEEREDSKNDRSGDKYRARRMFRETSEEMEEAKIYKCKEKPKCRNTSQERENTKSRSYDNYYRAKRKMRDKSEEKEDSKTSYDKYAERRRIKEERRRSVYSRYIYKSSRRETDRNSWTETRHKIKIRTENTSNKYNQIRRDYKKYESSPLREKDRRKSPSPSELTRIKLKYQWVNPNYKTCVKDIPIMESVKLEDIPLPAEAVENSVPNPAVSDVSESSMCDLDITPVDMVLSPVRGDDEICVESTITTSLPFPFPTESIKSESAAETSNNQTSSKAIHISVPNSTIELSTQNNYVRSDDAGDQQTTLQDSYNEIQQLDYYPQGSTPVPVPYTHQAPPVLSPQYDGYHRPQQRNNRNEFRLLREFTEQTSITTKQKYEQQSGSAATPVEEVAVKMEEVTAVPQPVESKPKPNDVQELNEDEKQMEIINRFLKKLLENEHTRAAASVFIENVSNSLDDEKLKKAVNTVMSPKKQSKVNKGRIVNRKLVLDDDDDVDSSKETTKKKNSKPVIDDDETEEVTSTVQDDRKPSTLKKKKSELDLLHEDLRGMFIHDGILTSTGKRMCCLLKDDTDIDTKTFPQPERRTRSLTKKFDMKSSENQKQLRILRSARVVIPVKDNLSKGKTTNTAYDTDEDEYFYSIRRSRKARYIEDSEEEHSSPKRSHKTCVDEKIKKGKHLLRGSNKSLKKNVDEESEDEMTKNKEWRKKEYILRQSNKISWSYAEDDSDGETIEGRKPRGRGEEHLLRQSGKVSWSYAEENSEDDEDAKQKREEYSLRRSNKLPKNYVEIDSDDELIKKKIVSKESYEIPKESPKKSCVDDKSIKDEKIKMNNVNEESDVISKESPKKSCEDDQNVKDGRIKKKKVSKESNEIPKGSPKKSCGNTSSKEGSPKKKQEQKAKVEEKTSNPHKIIRRKKVSQWALGVIPKLKKKKKEQSESRKSAEIEETETSLEFVEPDKTYCAPQARSYVVCRLCPFKGRSIAQHYKQEHPEYEVLCSRLQPNQAEKAIRASIEQKLEQSEDYVLQKSHKYHFQCRFCNVKMNTTVSFFYDHISCHTGEFRHVCSECSYGSSGSKTLRSHYLKVHNKPRDNKRIISHISTEVYGYLCLECNYVQTNKRSVEDHVNIYHLGEGKKIMKINLSSIVISKREDIRPLKSQAPKVNKKTATLKEKRKFQLTQNNSSENKKEAPVKKTKMEDETITLLSLLENFEKNNERVDTDLQKELAERNDEATKLIANTKKNVSKLQKAKETTELTISMKKCQSLTLSQLLNEKQIKQEQEGTEDSVNVKRGLCSDLDRHIDKEATEIIKKHRSLNSEHLPKEKCIKLEKRQIELSESMKKKWQSLNLDELTIKILKKGDTCASEESEKTLLQANAISSILHATEDLDKTEPSLENEGLELDSDSNSDDCPSKLSNEVEKTKMKDVEVHRITKFPTEKVKKIDMSVFTCKTDLQEENEKIDQERLQKMMQLNETIKKKRQSFSIVEQLSSRLLQEGKTIAEEKIAVASFERVHSGGSDSTTSTSLTVPPQKIPVTFKDNATILMSAGFFDVFKKSDELEFVCRMSPCSFTSKYRDTFAAHLDRDHVKINDQYKITECSACQGKLVQNPEKTFLRNFFLHMVEKHLDINDAECDQNAPKEKTVDSAVTQDGDNVMKAGLLDIIKGTNTLKYVCRVVFCTFTSKNRNAFITHWTEEHSNFRMTQCRFCGSEIAASPGNNLLLSFFSHLDEEHLSVKSRKLQANPFSFEISEVISVDEDPTPLSSPTEQQNFVIESVVSLADEAEPVAANKKIPEEDDNPPFVIEDVMSLADDLESPVTSNKEKSRCFVIENVVSVAENPPPSSKQEKPSFIIENVVSLAEIPKACKSESALKVFLEHPMEVYKCPQFYCHFFCESRNFFDMHVKAHGTPNQLVCCVYCDVNILMNNAGHHIDAYHQNCQYSCSQCLYRALRKEYVMVHMKLKHKKASPITSLPKPLKTYTSQVKSFALNETCHPYRCGHNECHAEFLFQSDFILHLTNAHDGAMVCGYMQKQSSCPYRCANADNMIDHWKSHSCYSFHCLICQVGSMELYTMLEHYSFTHPNRRPNIVDRRRGPMNEIHGYNGRAFARIKYVTNEIFSSLGARHYNIELYEIIQSEDKDAKSNFSEEMLLKKFGTMCEPAEKELKCPLCVHFKTKKISYFIYHLFLELKCHRFKCKSCDYSCITYGAMVIHCQDDHKSNSMSNMTESPIDETVQYWIELVINYQAKAITSKFSFERGDESQSVFCNIQCDVCQKWFKDMDTLHEHELYHWTEMIYICGLCRARRPTLNETWQHIRITHSGLQCAVMRIPSVTKIISTWKSLKSSRSQLKEESVTGFQRVQQNSDSQQVLMLPSSTVGQQDAALYACLHCPKIVKSVEMLQKHNLECHNGKTDNFKCKILTKSKVEVMLLMFVLP